jgi:hypothetical protein
VVRGARRDGQVGDILQHLSRTSEADPDLGLGREQQPANRRRDLGIDELGRMRVPFLAEPLPERFVARPVLQQANDS